MTDYQLCVIEPPGYPHTGAMLELVNLVRRHPAHLRGLLAVRRGGEGRRAVPHGRLSVVPGDLLTLLFCPGCKSR